LRRLRPSSRRRRPAADRIEEPMTLPTVQSEGPRGGDEAFIGALVAELSRRGLSLHNLGWFLRTAYEKSRDEVCENPAFARSVLGYTLGLFVLLFCYSAGVSLLLDHGLAVASLVSGSVWLLLCCGWVLAHTGLARDCEGLPLSRMSAPNVITEFRCLLVPLMVAAAVRDHVGVLGALFAAGGASDGLDGLVARRLGKVTRLGTLMDLLVDVQFGTAIFFSLAWTGLVSNLVGALVALRYAILVIGGAYLYIRRGPVTIRPTLFGKVSGAILYVMVLGRILSRLYAEPTYDARMAELFDIGFVVLVSVTILQAFAIGWYNLRGAGTRLAPRTVVRVLRLR